MADPRLIVAKSPAIAMLNPCANGGRAAELRRPVAQWLARYAPDVPLLTPGSVHEARAMLTILAVRTRVVLIGGDGTLSAMLPALLKGGLRVGLAPAGQRNSVAAALGLMGLSTEQTLMYALRARTGPVDVGLIETDHTTLHFIAEIGLDSDAPPPAPGAPPNMSVWINGPLNGAPTLSGSTQSLRVCNAVPQASAPAWANKIAMDDGAFDVLSWAGPPSWKRLLAPAGRWSLRPQVDPTRAVHQQGQTLRIEAGEPLVLHVDGEPLDATRNVYIDLLPRALDLTGSHVVAPRDPQRFVDTIW